MEQSYKILKNKTFKNLIIPGTHEDLKNFQILFFNTDFNY